MSAGEMHPEIELVYVTRKEDAHVLPYLFAAGLGYDQSRGANEAVSVQAEKDNKGASVKYGRKILETMSYAEMVHEAEIMQAEIEQSAVLVENDISARQYFAGHRLVGPLPEQE